MNAKTKERLGIGAAIVLVAAVTAVVAWNWRPANNANFPDGTFWICQNDSCHHEFVLTMEQLSEHHKLHYGQPIPCPKCGQAGAIRALRCPSCGKFYPQPRDPMPCPFCGKMPPKPVE
jgi:hypothetical protein